MLIRAPPGLDPVRSGAALAAYRVLLVEDDPGEAEWVLDRLSVANPGAFDLTHVVSMRQACRTCETARFDCIVLDLQLPDAAGSAAIRTMKRSAGDAAIVAYSALDDEAARATSLAEGVQDFISKTGPEAGSLDRSILVALERRRAMKLHRQFEELFYAHPDAMMVVDANGDVLFVNRGAEPLLTIEASPLADRLEHMQPGEGCEIELTLDGKPYVGELRIVACDWDGAPARLAVIRDITELKRLSVRYRKLKKMQVIGRFAGGLAHDFGNVLGCIDVVAAVAQKDLEPESFGHDRLQDIRTAAASGRALVDQLLSLEKSQKPEPQLSDPREILSRVEQIVGTVLPPAIEFKVDCAAGVPKISVDASNLEQALFNLAFNAREAMPNGGRLSISCGVEADALVFRVSDTGRGIASEHVPHVFDLFHSTKPRGGGHGLGLAICQAITEQAGGSIWVESTPGAGAQFIIALPLSLARTSEA